MMSIITIMIMMLLPLRSNNMKLDKNSGGVLLHRPNIASSPFFFPVKSHSSSFSELHGENKNEGNLAHLHDSIIQRPDPVNHQNSPQPMNNLSSTHQQLTNEEEVDRFIQHLSEGPDSVSMNDTTSRPTNSLATHQELTKKDIDKLLYDQVKRPDTVNNENNPQSTTDSDTLSKLTTDEAIFQLLNFNSSDEASEDVDSKNKETEREINDLFKDYIKINPNLFKDEPQDEESRKLALKIREFRMLLGNAASPFQLTNLHKTLNKPIEELDKSELVKLLFKIYNLPEGTSLVLDSVERLDEHQLRERIRKEIQELMRRDEGTIALEKFEAPDIDINARSQMGLSVPKGRSGFVVHLFNLILKKLYGYDILEKAGEEAYKERIKTKEALRLGIDRDNLSPQLVEKLLKEKLQSDRAFAGDDFDPFATDLNHTVGPPPDT